MVYYGKGKPMGKDDAKYRYVVRGRWPFPMDMLRHDMAMGETKEDQDKIDLYSSENVEDANVFHPTEIKIIGWCKPTGARWESFGWEIPFDADWQRTKLWKAEEKNKTDLRRSGLSKLTPEERKALGI